MKKLLLFFCYCTLMINCGEEVDCCVLPIETFSFNGSADGCSNFYVYKENQEKRLHLAVHGDRDKLGVDLTEKEFSLPNEHLTVEVLLFDGEIGSYACDDVANDQAMVVGTWTAISGTVSIQITEDSISVNPWEMTYKMTVKLKEVQVENLGNSQAVVKDTEFEEVYVGWLPG